MLLVIAVFTLLYFKQNICQNNLTDNIMLISGRHRWCKSVFFHGRTAVFVASDGVVMQFKTNLHEIFLLVAIVVFLGYTHFLLGLVVSSV